VISVGTEKRPRPTPALADNVNEEADTWVRGKRVLCGRVVGKRKGRNH